MKCCSRRLFLLIICPFFFWGRIHAGPGAPADSGWMADSGRMADEVRKGMQEGNIPGMSLYLIEDGEGHQQNFGKADNAHGVPVTSETLFELGSCSKAFTALAVLLLDKEHKISLNDPVSNYLPGFSLSYNGEAVPITIFQLLHHTSGIPWHYLSLIPESDDPNALSKLVQKIRGMPLNSMPGTNYEYSSINYDILGCLIERVSHERYAAFIKEKILLPLGMTRTIVGQGSDLRLATGYKIGFFRPREYVSPAFSGNTPAAYVTSDAEDMGTWLQYQLGLKKDPILSPLIAASHERDGTVAPHGVSSYGMGWEISLSGDGMIMHSGLNPNYTAYVGFIPGRRTGIVLLANSNSELTAILGNDLLKMLNKEPSRYDSRRDTNADKALSIIDLFLAAYILGILFFTGNSLREIIKGKRKFRAPARKEMLPPFLLLLFSVPFGLAIYLIPYAFADFTWKTAFVWTPVSFAFLIVLLVTGAAISYASYFISFFFRAAEDFKKAVPKLILISTASGIANMGIIIMITSSLRNSIDLLYLLFYYALAFVIYIFGRKYVQINLIHRTRGLTFELRMQLIDKIFCTRYENFEKIHRGRLYTVLNDDIATVGNSSNIVISATPNLITVVASMFYLAAISFWATMLIAGIIITISALYYLVSKMTRKYFEEARNSQGVFMGLLNGLADGFKELSLSRHKKVGYNRDVRAQAKEFKEKISFASTRFVNAFLVGESLLILVLGFASFGIPKLFPDLAPYTVTSFVVVLLYLIGPVNNIINSWPSITEMRVAWGRIEKFMHEIPATLDLGGGAVGSPADERVESIRVRDLKFHYGGEGSGEGFGVGPVNLEIGRGEIVFIVGANGSGKTTLAKLLTGLYQPDSGQILINDKPVSGQDLSEYYSAVFNPVHLFETIYEGIGEDRTAEIDHVLKMLDLDKKVTIDGSRYSTIDLSSGQRKRLALLQCYIEARPIYLFDEWAADQDPEYRHFFYRNLLPEMKERGKIVIAITHDDHYFDAADRIIKLNFGKVETISTNFRVENLFDKTAV